MTHLPLELARALADRLLVASLITLMLAGLLIYHRGHHATPDLTPREAAELGLSHVLSRVPDARLNAPLDDGNTLLCLAARFGRTAAAQTLLARGADPNLPGRFGAPLMEAARAAHPDTLRVLLAAGADVHASTPDGNDAVQDAVRCQSLDCLDLLLAAGASLARPGMMDNPLSLVARPDETPFAAYLLSRGADPNFPGRNGWTPLKTAIGERSTATIDLFLAAGANSADAQPELASVPNGTRSPVSPSPSRRHSFAQALLKHLSPTLPRHLTSADRIGLSR